MEFASTGNEKRASKVLGIGQSTISYHIKKLEEEIGDTLVCKNKEGEVLTDKGRKIYSIVKMFMDQYRTEISKQPNISTLRVGITPPLYPYLTEFFKVKYFSTNRSEVKFNTYVSSSGENLKMLSRQVLDMCFVGSLDFSFVKNGMLNGKRLKIIPILSDKFVVVHNMKYDLFGRVKKMSLEQLSKYPYISREKTSGTYRGTMEMFKAHNINRKDIYIMKEADNFFDVLKCLEKYPAYSVVSNLQLMNYNNLKKLNIIEITPKPLSKRYFFLAYIDSHIDHYLDKLVVEVKNYLATKYAFELLECSATQKDYKVQGVIPSP